jgi:hypothetical protein
VNNTIYNRYAETGRVEWASKFARYIDPANAEEWRYLWVPKKEVYQSKGVVLKGSSLLERLGSTRMQGNTLAGSSFVKEGCCFKDILLLVLRMLTLPL